LKFYKNLLIFFYLVNFYLKFFFYSISERKITVTIVAEIKVKEGKMEEAKEVLKEVVKTVKANEPGTLEYTPHTVRKEDNTIIFVERYVDGDAVKAHMANLGKNMAKLGPLLETVPPNIKTCFPIE
jgi:quinol monooxygenase YgiN